MVDINAMYARGEDKFPEPYYRGLDDGFIYKRTQGNSGIEWCFCEYRVYDAWLSEAPSALHFRVGWNPFKDKEVHLELKNLANPSSTAKALYSQGFFCPAHKEIWGFFRLYVVAVQRQGRTRGIAP